MACGDRLALVGLGVILREAAPEALLFGQMISIVQRCQVRDSFFGFLATIGVDNVQAVSRGQRIQKIYHAVFVILG